MLNNKAFTLIELLVVITIIGTLSIVGMSSFINISQKAKVTKRKADIDAIAKAYEVKYNNADRYQALTDNNFASGKIPTPYEGGSYFMVGPNSGRTGDTGFTVCASTMSDTACLPGSANCVCKTSSLETATVIASLPSPSPSGGANPTPTPMPTSTPAPIVFDNATTSSNNGSTNNVSWSHSIGSTCTNPVLVVGASIRGGIPVTSVTFGSQSFTKITANQLGGDIRSELWYLKGPSGTNNITVTINSAQNIAAGATSWCNIDQTTPIGIPAGGTTACWAGGSSSLAVATSIGGIVVDNIAGQNGGDTLTANSTQTLRYNKTGAAETLAGSSKIAITNSTTMSWTVGGDNCSATSAVSLTPIGATAPTPTPAPTIAPYNASSFSPKVLLLIYNPIQSNGQKLTAYRGWSDPDTLATSFISSISSATNGFVSYTIAARIEINGYPVKNNGFQLTNDYYNNICLGGNPDSNCNGLTNYVSTINAADACTKRNNGTIDELWVFGGPWFGYWESNLAGPNAFWYNSSPTTGTTCTKLLPIMGFSYERGVAEMLHDVGHRLESTMSRVYGSAASDPGNPWYKFSSRNSMSPGNGGCGITHFPVNTSQEYNYGDSATASSTCDDFRNYPNLTGAKQNISCSAWGCSQQGFFEWMFGRMPKATGQDSSGFLSDWWAYLLDPQGSIIDRGF